MCVCVRERETERERESMYNVGFNGTKLVKTNSKQERDRARTRQCVDAFERRMHSKVRKAKRGTEREKRKEKEKNKTKVGLNFQRKSWKKENLEKKKISTKRLTARAEDTFCNTKSQREEDDAPKPPSAKCTHTHTHTHKRTHAHTRTHKEICIYICICITCIYIKISVIYICVYIALITPDASRHISMYCLRVCICVYKCMYTYIFTYVHVQFQKIVRHEKFKAKKLIHPKP